MTILLIEDDQHISKLLSVTLSTHHYAVDTVADGLAGLELATQWSYDLILLDVLLPGLNGVEVCRRLRAGGCKTPVLMLTVKDSNEDVVAGLDAGADDYVAKSCAPSQLLARVRALLRRGSSAAAAPILTWGGLCLDPALAQVTYNQQSIACRPKEYSLLELFLRHPQRILSRSAIIDHLWSIEETPVEGSVTNLIKDLRQRLKSAGMTDNLIETVYGLGYRLNAAPAASPATSPATSPAENSAASPAASQTAGRASRAVGQAVRAEASAPLPTVDWDDDWKIRTQRGKLAIQQVTARFSQSLQQRIALLEAAQQSLRAGDFSLQQQSAIRTEAHKLAGGLGTFGCTKASDVAHRIEQLLDVKLDARVNAEGIGDSRENLSFAEFAYQFSQLLQELKQELAQPPVQSGISSSVTSSSVTSSSVVNSGAMKSSIVNSGAR